MQRYNGQWWVMLSCIHTMCSPRCHCNTSGQWTTHLDTVGCPGTNVWLATMSIELNMFKEIGLYQEVKGPPDCKIINSKWVFKIKHGPNSKINKYKVHLIAKGYMQIEGLGYMDTFIPITKFTTICSLRTHTCCTAWSWSTSSRCQSCFSQWRIRGGDLSPSTTRFPWQSKHCLVLTVCSLWP